MAPRSSGPRSGTEPTRTRRGSSRRSSRDQWSLSTAERFGYTTSRFCRRLAIGMRVLAADGIGFDQSACKADVITSTDRDLQSLSREDLVQEVIRLREGIRRHRDSTGHEL